MPESSDGSFTAQFVVDAVRLSNQDVKKAPSRAISSLLSSAGHGERQAQCADNERLLLRDAVEELVLFQEQHFTHS